MCEYFRNIYECFCLILINCNIISKVEGNLFTYVFNAGMIQTIFNKLQIATWAAPNHEHVALTSLEKTWENKSFSKERVCHTELINSLSIHWNKRPAFVSIIHGSVGSWQSAQGWGQCSRETAASCLRPAQLTHLPDSQVCGGGRQTRLFPHITPFPPIQEIRLGAKQLSSICFLSAC